MRTGKAGRAEKRQITNVKDQIPNEDKSINFKIVLLPGMHLNTCLSFHDFRLQNTLLAACLDIKSFGLYLTFQF